MENNPVEISGLTSQEQLSTYNIQYPCKEVCKSYDITLPESKPNIELILKIFLKPEVTQWKYILTHDKHKIFIEGLLNVRVLFIGDLYSKNIYSTEFNKSFSELLPITTMYTDNLKPHIFIEEAFINHLNKKRFSLSTLMLVCTTLDVHTNVKIMNNLSNIEVPLDKNLDKNKKNSIDINVEYDMKSGEESFK